jgi:hypothetical protein
MQPHTCPICGLGRNEPGEFIEHIQTHSGIRALLTYPPKEGEAVSTRTGAIYIEFPKDIVIQARNRILYDIEKTIEAGMSKLTWKDILEK